MKLLHVYLLFLLFNTSVANAANRKHFEVQTSECDQVLEQPVLIDQKELASLHHALTQLPDNIFEAIFYKGAAKNKVQVARTVNLSVEDVKLSYKEPRVFYIDSKFSSRLVIIDGDVYVEGFYRNFRYQTATDMPQPWFRWNNKTKKFNLEKSGAEIKLAKAFLKKYRTSEATAVRKISLFRGTKEDQMQDLLEVKRLASSPATYAQALAAATKLSLALRNGLFSTDDEDRAKAYANPSLISIKINPDTIMRLVSEHGVYVGYEFYFFELCFQSPAAILEFAEAIVVKQ